MFSFVKAFGANQTYTTRNPDREGRNTDSGVSLFGKKESHGGWTGPFLLRAQLCTEIQDHANLGRDTKPEKERPRAPRKIPVIPCGRRKLAAQLIVQSYIPLRPTHRLSSLPLRHFLFYLTE